MGEVRWINNTDSSFHSATLTTDGLPGVFPASLPLPLGYKDQWVYIAGADVQLDDHWRLSLGYHYGTQPVSNANLLPIVDGIVTHHITTGLIYEQDQWWVGGGYILGLPHVLSGNGESPFPAPNDYASGRISQTQHNLFFGFGFAW